MFSEINGVPTQNLPPWMHRFMDAAVEIVITEEQGRGLPPDDILYEMMMIIHSAEMEVSPPLLTLSPPPFLVSPPF